MTEARVEARLFWGSDLEAVTYTAAAGDVCIDDLRLPPIPGVDRARVVARREGHGRVVVEEPIVELGAFVLYLAIVDDEQGGAPRTVGDGRVVPALFLAATLHTLLGAIAMATDWADSSMPDRAVTACVVRRFYDLTFPQPEGGIVTVVYPIAFSTSS